MFWFFSFSANHKINAQYAFLLNSGKCVFPSPMAPLYLNHAVQFILEQVARLGDVGEHRLSSYYLS